jgi:hypothetical protein
MNLLCDLSVVNGIEVKELATWLEQCSGDMGDFMACVQSNGRCDRRWLPEEDALLLEARNDRVKYGILREYKG